MANKRPSHKHWFHSDEYFWGWYPVSWQGWLVLTAYLMFLLYLSWTLLPHSGHVGLQFSHQVITWFGLVALSVISLVIIVWKTGGKPHGRRH